MSWTLNGNLYDVQDFVGEDGNGYASIWEQFWTDFSAEMEATAIVAESSTSHSITAGAKTFFLNRNLGPVEPGTSYVIFRTSNPLAARMVGTVTGANRSNYSVSVSVGTSQILAGSGTGPFTDWTLVLTGEQGATGVTGPTGITGPPGADGAGSGTVSSVGFVIEGAASTMFSSLGTSVSSSGTLKLRTLSQSANRLLAGPASGSNAEPTFRAVVKADLPYPETYIVAAGFAVDPLHHNNLWAVDVTTTVTVTMSSVGSYTAGFRFSTHVINTGAVVLQAFGSDIIFDNYSQTQQSLVLQQGWGVTLRNLGARGWIVEEDNRPPIEVWTFAVGDQTTNIATGTGKFFFNIPYDLYLTEIPKATLASASTSGNPTFDINMNGTTILGANKLSVDSSEKTSSTAATPTTLATTMLNKDSVITVDIDTAGTNAKGPVIFIFGRRAN